MKGREILDYVIIANECLDSKLKTSSMGVVYNRCGESI